METYIKNNKEYDSITRKKVYEGEFYNGLRHGSGVLIEDNLVYKGEFRYGNKHGNGIEYNKFTKKWIYKGGFSNNSRSGYGKEKDGKFIYKGEYNNLRNGFFKVYNNITNKLVYKGYYKDGKMHGDGELYVKLKHFEGRFSSGDLIEANEYIFNDKENEYNLVYTGEFKNYKRHGKGIEYDFETGKSTFIGIYKNNSRIKGKSVKDYVNHCFKCGKTIDSDDNEPCFICYWYKCECGACGCSYLKRY